MQSSQLEKEMISFLVEQTNRTGTTSFQKFILENFGEEISRSKINYVIENLAEQDFIKMTKTFGDEYIVITITNKGKSLYEDGYLS